MFGHSSYIDDLGRPIKGRGRIELYSRIVQTHLGKIWMPIVLIAMIRGGAPKIACLIVWSKLLSVQGNMRLRMERAAALLVIEQMVQAEDAKRSISYSSLSAHQLN